MTVTDIEAELVLVREAILRITAGKTASYSIGGRQLTYEPKSGLPILYAREKELERDRTRLQNGVGGGIVIRYGVVR